MPQDAFTLRYLAEELNSIFKGGKVNRIVAPSNDEVVLTIYNGKRTYKFLIDVNPVSPRIGVTEEEKPSPLTAPNFCMLLRKHLLNAELKGISLIGFDRIVRVDFFSSNEFFDGENKSLYIELMGRYSNVILTKDDIVLGCNRGINNFCDSVRPLIVGLKYNFPPVNEKLLPSDESLIKLFDNVNISETVNLICEKVQGIAKSTAQKIVDEYLEHNDYKIIDGKTFYKFLNEFLYNHSKQPVVVLNNGKVVDVCVFPYNEEKTIPFNFLYEAEEYYFNEKYREKNLTEKKNRAFGVINALIKKAKKRISTINGRIEETKDIEKLKLYGELLIANIYRLKNGESEVSLENYYDENKIVTIPLNVNLSIKQNAENYYKKYQKQKRSLLTLIPQKEQAEQELLYYESLYEMCVLADNLNDIELVIFELEENGLIKKQNNFTKKKVETKQYRLYNIEGFNVKVGRNNIENDKLTFSSKPENLWVHAKDYHSSHIIIEVEGKTLTEKIIKSACEICAYYSKGREGGKTEIVVTEKKNVKKPPKSKLGFCTYLNYKSYMVEPLKHEEYLIN
ncbi:MAG: NFACT family protein [Firmicutes bacterium]|nr:NFACT family protein [Candidatus Caballimonas caccae]